MRLDGVATNANDGGVEFPQLRGEVAEVLCLDGAAGGGVARVEVHDDGAGLRLQVGQGEGCAARDR